MGGGDSKGHFTLVPVYSIFYFDCLFTFSPDDRFLSIPTKIYHHEVEHVEIIIFIANEDFIFNWSFK